MTKTRRVFIQTPLAAAAMAQSPPKDDISLASWALNRSFRAGQWKNLDLPRILRERLGINGLEYVNQYFENPTLTYLRRLKKACQDQGIVSVLIMVDEEDPTASPDQAERMAAAVAHRKWVDVAHFLGCHAIRCNMRGGPPDWKQDRDLVKRAADTFRSILAYAKGSGVRVLIENHGGSSSDPDVLVALMKEVGDPNFGMHLDVGNWSQGVDRYEATRRLAPWSKAMSVKDSPGWDLEKLLRILLEGGYHGWWGIECGTRAGTSPQEILEAEVDTALQYKAVVERVVLKKG